jgi:hypothetical protein
MLFLQHSTPNGFLFNLFQRVTASTPSCVIARTYSLNSGLDDDPGVLVLQYTLTLMLHEYR